MIHSRTRGKVLRSQSVDVERSWPYQKRNAYPFCYLPAATEQYQQENDNKSDGVELEKNYGPFLQYPGENLVLHKRRNTHQNRTKHPLPTQASKSRIFADSGATCFPR
mmetsp:Transcript_5872/g.13046  ORF Transcript_5872/g.13046 Transcript_5872/m.13046 type:complete len:108 (-) Transcript_5872:112-435(-)